MLKFKLSTLFVLFSILVSSAQFIVVSDSIKYKKKTLSFDEANLLTSVYYQDGNHSGVTGGIGTESLFDNSNIFDVKFVSQSITGKKKAIGMEIGVDFYTSASSDNIDFRKSSASSQDVRFYPSLSYSVENQIKKQTLGAKASFSSEYDYKSVGGGLQYAKTFNKGMTDIQGSINGFYDSYLLILPIELRTSGNKRYSSTPRRSFDGSLSISHIMSERVQLSLIMDLAYQSGLLSTPFHRVYANDGSLLREILPSTRLKTPLGLRVNAFVTEKLLLRTFYRYFQDDWGMVAHTVQVEAPIKVSSKLSLSPSIRYHQQSGIDYFEPYQMASPTAEFRSSDYDLSNFKSYTVGMNVRILPFKQLYKSYSIAAIEIRPSYYHRSDGMSAGIIAAHIQFKKM